MKKLKVIILITFSLLLFGGFKLVSNGSNRDLRLVSFGDWGMELINISLQRRLVSVAVIPAETKLWIPGGYGWYEAGKVAKLVELTGEGRKLLVKLLFYNFGLIADRVIKQENPNWWKSRLAMFEINDIGWWWNWEISSRQMLEKNEPMTVVDSERMGREFADINWLSDSSLRWVVVNRSGMNGLATMVGERLDWAGVWVSGVTNDTETNTDCMIKRPSILAKVDEEIVSSIVEIIGCGVEATNDGNTTEVVVELGKRWGEMIKYDNYVRSF